MSVFARHGLKNLLERTNLDKFSRFDFKQNKDVEHLSIPERVRLSFEELGPTFVKFGQLLASRPDLVPEEFIKEFERLHDNVKPLTFETVMGVIDDECVSQHGKTAPEIFSFIDPHPLGAASIAQVHKAILITGEQVVIKVQRPGIIHIINEDLSVLYLLAELLEKYVPEVKAFNPVAIVDEYFKTLDLETNFVVEANNIRRFQENFKDHEDIVVPQVYIDLTTSRMLVMEMLSGLPLSNHTALSQAGVDAHQIVIKGLKAYLKMVFMDGLFHGDLHAGNFFVLENNQIGLIDFGVVGRLNSRTQSVIVNMLIALSKEDYERLAYEYVDLAPFSDRVNVDAFAKDLRSLIAPYYGLTLKHVNIGKILMSSSGVAAKHHLSLPTELMMFFKSLVAIEGVGVKIQKDFDFLKYTLDMVGDVAKYQLEPGKWTHELSMVMRESRSLVMGLPRQLTLVLRRLASPDYATKHEIKQLDELKKSIELSFNLMFLGLIIGSLILSSSILITQHEALEKMGVPTLGFIGFAMAGFLGLIAFINYIKK